jgi:hypothetical protein
MLTKQSLFLIPVLLIVSTGVASANNIEVKTGNTQVSVGNQGINIKKSTSPSLIDRLVNWRVFRSGSSSIPSQVSNKCSQSSSTYSSSRSTGGGVVRSSSSSSTTACQ